MGRHRNAPAVAALRGCSYVPPGGLWPEITPPAAGELCEEQRLDHHRHHARRGDQGADIDIIELLQLHAVDGDDFPWPVELAVHDPAKSLADVAVDHQEEELDLVLERLEG